MGRHGWCAVLLAGVCTLTLGCEQPAEVVSPTPAVADADASPAFVQSWAEHGQVDLVARCNSAGRLITLSADGDDLLVLAARRGERPADLFAQLLGRAADRAAELGRDNLVLRFDMDRASADLLLADRLLPVQITPVAGTPMNGRLVMAVK